MSNHENIEAQVNSLQEQINDLVDMHKKLREEHDNMRTEYYHHLGTPQPESPATFAMNTKQGPMPGTEMPRETLRRT